MKLKISINTDQKSETTNNNEIKPISIIKYTLEHVMIKNIVILIPILVLLTCVQDTPDPSDNVSLPIEKVQAMVDKAQSGDTILLPAGKFTWTTPLTIPDEKKLTIRGSGMAKTIISSDLPTQVIDLNESGSRVTQIGFKLVNDIGVGIRVGGQNWRIDHCKFDFTGSGDYTIEGVYAYGSTENHPIGVIDHCEFTNIRVCVIGHQRIMAHERWAEPLALGTNNAVFIEDCIFTRTFSDRNVVDSNYGARYVFRYNTVNDGQIMAHSVQHNSRGSRSWEIYNNTINQVQLSLFTPIFLRGGTGVVFNNVLNGKWSKPNIVLDNYRSFREFEGGGLADGSSLWDGNEEANGYPARDQIGRSTDQWLWTDDNPYPPQQLDPMYQWNNTINGQNMNVYIHNNCDHHIKENRDYYNNVAMPDYTPYTYPHPLVLD